MHYRPGEPPESVKVIGCAHAYPVNLAGETGRVVPVLDLPFGFLPLAAAFVGAEPAPAGRQWPGAPVTRPSPAARYVAVASAANPGLG